MRSDSYKDLLSERTWKFGEGRLISLLIAMKMADKRLAKINLSLPHQFRLHRNSIAISINQWIKAIKINRIRWDYSILLHGLPYSE